MTSTLRGIEDLLVAKSPLRGSRPWLSFSGHREGLRESAFPRVKDPRTESTPRGEPHRRRTCRDGTEETMQPFFTGGRGPCGGQSPGEGSTTVAAESTEGRRAQADRRGPLRKADLPPKRKGGSNVCVPYLASVGPGGPSHNGVLPLPLGASCDLPRRPSPFLPAHRGLRGRSVGLADE